MKNYEIINLINHFCRGQEEWDDYINTDIVFAIVAHGYLYIRPGKDTEEFAMKIMNSISSAVEEGVNNYLGPDGEIWPFDSWIRISLAKAALTVARELFDADYFEEKYSSYDINEEETGEYLLDKYLNLMDKDQLIDFDEWIDEWRTHYYVFTTVDMRHEVYRDFNEKCRKINPAVPTHDNMLEYVEYEKNHPEFDMFDFLSKEEIINGISKEIIFDRSLAGHMARLYFDTCDINLIETYIELASHYRSIFHRDIYTPDDIFYETIYL